MDVKLLRGIRPWHDLYFQPVPKGHEKLYPTYVEGMQAVMTRRGKLGGNVEDLVNALPEELLGVMKFFSRAEKSTSTPRDKGELKVLEAR